MIFKFWEIKNLKSKIKNHNIICYIVVYFVRIPNLDTMSRYILKKILMIVPTVFLLALLVFFISQFVPGDNVDAYLELNGSILNEEGNTIDEEYANIAKKLKLDLPSFYFSIHPELYPDNLHKFKIYPNYKLRKSLLDKYKDWSRINKVFANIGVLKNALVNTDDSIKNQFDYRQFKMLFKELDNSGNYSDFESNAKILSNHSFADYYNDEMNNFQISYDELKNSKAKVSQIIPRFSWYGSNNRFHNWFGQVLHLNFGTSIIDGQKVFTKINSSLKWTLLYILIAFIMTFGIAIPLGIYMSSHSDSYITKFLDWKLLGFHSVPLFWLSTLAVIFLTSSEITEMFNVFPSIGLGNIDTDMNWLTQMKIALPHLILPSLVIALHSGAYLTTLIKRSMQKEMDEKYFLAILSRGIKRKTTILKHIFPNSILPLITLIVVSLPASLAGSVVTEVVFNIPGMGRLLYNSILAYDWNVVFAIVLLIGIATYISYVIGDILYVYFNPKVKIDS